MKDGDGGGIVRQRINHRERPPNDDAALVKRTARRQKEQDRDTRY